MADSWEPKLVTHYLSIKAKWQGEEDHYAAKTFSNAIEWLEDSREATDPFFLYIDSFDPHEPFDPPRKYVDLYDPGYEGVEMIHPHYGPTRFLSEAELKHMRALYAGAVTMVDTWFGKFMDKLRELGHLDNTLFILTSDHGFQLGEHGVAGKVPAGMYWELMDAPLMIRHPQGIGAGGRNDALVQHQDIFATILSCLGMYPPYGLPYELDGKDLMPIMEGKKTKVRDYATCGMQNSVWSCDDEYVLICQINGDEPQLFDMRNDPEQHENIAKDKPEVVKRMFDLVLADANGGLDKLPPTAIPTSIGYDRTPFKDWALRSA